MNKDALLATCIGFGIGLVITGLLLVGPSILAKLPKIHFPTKTVATPTPQPQDATFAIESPLPDTIEANQTLLVSGTAENDQIVVIAGPQDESVVIAKDGKFAGKITLAEGKNDIMVVQGTTQLSVRVFWTEESL